MAGAVIDTVSKLLKDVYMPPVVEQLRNDIYLLTVVTQVNDFDLVGNQIVLPLHTGRTGAIASLGELEALPAPQNQKFEKLVYDLTHHYGRFQVSGVSRAKTKNSVGSFLEVLKLEMDGLRTDLRRQHGRQVWGNSDGNTGGNGRIAKCGTTSATNVVVLDSDEPLRKGHLYIGQKVDIGTAAAPQSLVVGEEITAVDVANKTITITSAITTSTSHFVSNQKSAGKEINGLTDLVATTANTVGGIDSNAAGNEFWKNIVDSTGGALALDNMAKVWNQVVLSGGGPPNLVLCTYGLQRVYWGLVEDQVRYMNPMEFKAGYRSLSFMDKPLVADMDAKFGRLYFLNTSNFKHFVNEDWSWLDDDGNILKWVVGYDAWEGAIVKRYQIGINRRNNQAVMSGLTDATGF